MQGTLRGHDASINVILDLCVDRVFSMTEPPQSNPLGLYVVRGDNIAVIGEMEEEERDLSAARALPLEPVTH
jgi:U6 snRNA-associated Sm-like protein LSm8